MSTFLVKCDAATWQAYGFENKTIEQSQAICEQIRTYTGRPSADLEQIGVARFPVDLERELVARQHGADRRRAAFGAFLHRLGNAARDRGCDCADQGAGSGAGNPRRPCPLPGRTQADREEARNGGAHQRRLVENFPEQMKLDLMDFGYSYITRSGRIDDARLRAMSPAFIARYEASKNIGSGS